MRNQSEIRSIEAGFTLIELLIVMSVILILMTLAVPAMQKVTIHAHETSAVQSLRILSSAEGEYNGAYPQHGYACTLAQLGGNASAGPPTAEAAEIIGDDLVGGNKAGAFAYLAAASALRPGKAIPSGLRPCMTS